VIPDLGTDSGEYVLTTEAFYGILAEVSLPGSDPVAFLAQVVTFANERIAGNLACAVLVKPAIVLREPVEAAIEGLKYGEIGINVWPGVAFAIPSLAWGRFRVTRWQMSDRDAAPSTTAISMITPKSRCCGPRSGFGQRRCGLPTIAICGVWRWRRCSSRPIPAGPGSGGWWSRA
jgi:hypothetical protein